MVLNNTKSFVESHNNVKKPIRIIKTLRLKLQIRKKNNLSVYWNETVRRQWVVFTELNFLFLLILLLDRSSKTLNTVFNSLTLRRELSLFILYIIFLY